MELVPHVVDVIGHDADDDQCKYTVHVEEHSIQWLEFGLNEVTYLENSSKWSFVLIKLMNRKLKMKSKTLPIRMKMFRKWKELEKTRIFKFGTMIVQVRHKIPYPQNPRNTPSACGAVLIMAL